MTLNRTFEKINDNLFEEFDRYANMVKLRCIDCEQVEFEAESVQEMLTQMMPHYFEAHQDIMSGQSSESQEQWMERLTTAFNQANAS
jgi:hypothetical protein